MSPWQQHWVEVRGLSNGLEKGMMNHYFFAIWPVLVCHIMKGNIKLKGGRRYFGTTFSLLKFYTARWCFIVLKEHNCNLMEDTKLKFKLMWLLTGSGGHSFFLDRMGEPKDPDNHIRPNSMRNWISQRMGKVHGICTSAITFNFMGRYIQLSLHGWRTSAQEENIGLQASLPFGFALSLRVCVHSNP